MKKLINGIGVAMGVGLVVGLVAMVTIAADPWLGSTNASDARTALGLGSAATKTAASTNTASTVVLRDSSGDFAAGTITATAFTGTASTATLASTVTVADTTDTTCYVGLFEDATGSKGCKTDAGLTYNAGTGMLTATGLTGPLTGNASSATYAASTSIGLDTTTSAEMYPLWATATSGNLATKTTTSFHFNPNTGMLTVPGVTATVTGNATNVTGTVAVANGGTGATTAAAARTALGVANNVTSGTLVSIPVTTGQALGDIYVTTDSGQEAAYICVKIGADTTGWSKITP